MKVVGITAGVLILGACSWQEPDIASEPASLTLSPTQVGSAVHLPSLIFMNAPRYEAEDVFAPFSPTRRWMRPPVSDATESGQKELDALHAQGLDAMAYVGFMQSASKQVALVKAGGEVFSVRVGQRIGVEGARLLTITDDALAFYLPLNGKGSRAVALPRLRIQTRNKQDAERRN